MDNWLAVVGAVFAIAVLVGAVLAIARFKGLQTTVELMAIANTEMRGVIEFERSERHAGEKKCAEDLGKMQGQVDFLTGDLLARFLEGLQREAANLLAGAQPPGTPPASSSGFSPSS